MEDEIHQICPITYWHVWDNDPYPAFNDEFGLEWIDLLITSIGFNPTRFDERMKMLMLLRLVPFVEPNYNLIELGPAGDRWRYCHGLIDDVRVYSYALPPEEILCQECSRRMAFVMVRSACEGTRLTSALM
jgi:hypothetical protein